MAHQRICKQCGQAMLKGEKLKGHWQMKHETEYAEIKKWLGETEAKIESHAILAKEGLRGVGSDDPGIVGHRYDRGGRVGK